MAPSVDTRVRVDRFENVIATVLRASELRMEVLIDPDFTACLWLAALRTSAVSSEGVRSAIERKWRGAKGDVGGVEGVLEEYKRRRGAWHSVRRAGRCRAICISCRKVMISNS